jgi:hypothetical protein
MTAHEVLVGFRLRLFTLADEWRNVWAARRAMGVDCSTDYHSPACRGQQLVTTVTDSVDGECAQGREALGGGEVEGRRAEDPRASGRCPSLACPSSPGPSTRPAPLETRGLVRRYGLSPGRDRCLTMKGRPPGCWRAGMSSTTGARSLARAQMPERSLSAPTAVADRDHIGDIGAAGDRRRPAIPSSRCRPGGPRRASRNPRARTLVGGGLELPRR